METEPSAKRRRTDGEWRDLQRLWFKRVQKVFEGNGPPRPSLELKRREEVLRLRKLLSQKYEDLIALFEPKISFSREADSLGAPLPREAFNRWLMERLNAGGTDPLLGGQAPSKDLLRAAAEGLERDLCGPMRDTKLGAAERQEAEDSESCQVLQSSQYAKFSSKVRSLCSELANEADLAAERIAVISAGTLEAVKVSATLNAKRGCYVFSLDSQINCRSDLDEEVDGDAASGSDASPTFTLSPSALARLAKLMRRAARWAEKISNSDIAGEAWTHKFQAFMQEDVSFWDLTFCLLCRYDAMCGPGHKEGGGFHAAIPSIAFDALESIADERSGAVKVEAFASPQLCRGRSGWHFCSAFNDLDIFFGSLGRFLDEEMSIGRFAEKQGTTGTPVFFEVNPPFVRGVVLRLCEKLLQALELAHSEGRSLCIFLVLPGLAAHKFIERGNHGDQETDDSCDENNGEVRHDQEDQDQENHGEVQLTDHSSVQSDALDQLLTCRFRTAFHASTSRTYTNGLAFKTEKSWPIFAVPTTLAFFSSEPGRGVADFQHLCTAWHLGEKKGGSMLQHLVLELRMKVLSYFILASDPMPGHF